MVNAPALVRSKRAGSEAEPAALHVGFQPFRISRRFVRSRWHGCRTVSGIPRGRAVVAAHRGISAWGYSALWAICARSTFSSGDNPGRRCSRSELGATPQSREEFRELAAWYTNLESSHHYANRPVLSTVTAPGMDRELALLPEEFRRARYAQCCAGG